MRKKMQIPLDFNLKGFSLLFYEVYNRPDYSLTFFTTNTA